MKSEMLLVVGYVLSCGLNAKDTPKISRGRDGKFGSLPNTEDRSQNVRWGEIFF
jgi:hypothetical protein